MFSFAFRMRGRHSGTFNKPNGSLCGCLTIKGNFGFQNAKFSSGREVFLNEKVCGLLAISKLFTNSQLQVMPESVHYH